MTVIDMYSRRAKAESTITHDVLTKGFEAEAVANAFIDLAAQERFTLSHLRLQKVICMAHAWHLHAHGRRLISEQPRAWPLGPVVESVYAVIVQTGRNVMQPGVMIPSRFDADAQAPAPRLPLRHEDVRVREAVEEALITIKGVWDGSRHLSDERLSAILHRDGSAWHKAYSARMDTISDALMTEDAASWPSKGQKQSR